MFIAIEGPDCSGKTTQAERLVKRLRAQAISDVLHLAFPSESPAGAAARKLLQLGKLFVDPVSSDLPAVLLQSAMSIDRYGYADAIRDCLRLGGVVIADRWSESGLVYGGEDGLDLDWLAAAQSALPKPDLHVLLDVDVDTIMRRFFTRGRAAEKYENHAYQQKIVARYRNLWALRRGDAAWRVVDGSAPEAAVANAIYDLMVEHRRRSDF
jgi:dTMP kinase